MEKHIFRCFSSLYSRITVNGALTWKLEKRLNLVINKPFFGQLIKALTLEIKNTQHENQPITFVGVYLSL